MTNEKAYDILSKPPKGKLEIMVDDNNTLQSVHEYYTAFFQAIECTRLISLLEPIVKEMWDEKSYYYNEVNLKMALSQIMGEINS